MRVLALDLATTFGWCVDGADRPAPPRTGSLRLPGQRKPEYLGIAGRAFCDWLSEYAALWSPELVAFESPMQGGRGIRMHGNVPRLLIGLAFMTETLAYSLGIACEESSVQTIRKHFLGHGRPPNPKRAVMARCRQLGWEVGDDNAGDAAALWAYAKARRDRSFRLECATPLFARPGAEA